MRFATLFSLCCLTLCTPSVHAMAIPYIRGEPLAEMTGLSDVVVKELQLRIDLRPLQQQKPIVVSVTYRLNSAGTNANPSILIPMGPTAKESMEILLDGKRVSLPTSPLDESALADSVVAKMQMPKREQEGYFRPYPELSPWFSIPIELSRGDHTLTVKYRAQACAHEQPDDPHWNWYCSYVLEPTRQWKAIERFTVEIQVPNGWESATTLPELSRSANTWTGTFDELPAGEIGVETRAPVPAKFYGYYRIVDSWIMPIASGGFVLCLVLGWIGGARTTVREGAGLRLFLGSVCLTLVWFSVLVGLTYLGTYYAHGWVAPNQQTVNSQIVQVRSFDLHTLLFAFGSVGVLGFSFLSSWCGNRMCQSAA